MNPRPSRLLLPPSSRWSLRFWTDGAIREGIIFVGPMLFGRKTPTFVSNDIISLLLEEEIGAAAGSAFHCETSTPFSSKSSIIFFNSAGSRHSGPRPSRIILHMRSEWLLSLSSRERGEGWYSTITPLSLRSTLRLPGFRASRMRAIEARFSNRRPSQDHRPTRPEIIRPSKISRCPNPTLRLTRGVCLWLIRSRRRRQP